MRKIHLAELRDAWPTWLGVCLSFIAVNGTLALSVIIRHSGITAVHNGSLRKEDSTSYVFSAGMNLFTCGLIGMLVIGSATSLVVVSRRGSLARLGLAGATPAQIVRTLMIQLAAVTLACALIGDLLAMMFVQPLMDAMSQSQGMPRYPAQRSPMPILVANLVTVLMSLVAGWRQVRAASRIPPVDALREASAPPPERVTRAGWARFGFCLLLIGVIYGTLPLLTRSPNSETMSGLLQMDQILLILLAVVFATAMPAWVRPVVRTWTGLVPSHSPTWQLARAGVIARATRFSRTVVPVMLTISLATAMTIFDASVRRTWVAMGYKEEEMAGMGTAAFFSILGMPLLVALCGGVGTVLMMSRQRTAELALVSISGATPRQRLLIPLLEAVILTVTAAIFGYAIVAAQQAYLVIGVQLSHIRFLWAFGIWSSVAALAITAVVVMATTVLPTLPSMRLPEPKVIARLVAE